MPNLRDTDESAQAKINEVLDFIDRRIKAVQSAAKQEATGLGLQGQQPGMAPLPPKTPETVPEVDIEGYLEQQGL